MNNAEMFKDIYILKINHSISLNSKYAALIFVSDELYMYRFESESCFGFKIQDWFHITFI